ncbi:unnamed protein product [Triticum turgidum subsp. durum]|uniref:ATP-dependent DNA helicase n=1 Tax=Triticum turgidum subsp. durum TaxID=4567 RepID=A0A9R1S5R2_TRITD|nr:unnamed protein product [Triticum turgidum subsp. durum]
MTQNVDPMEQKRQLERERYSQNRDDILKRQRQAYSQKKLSHASAGTGAQKDETQTPMSTSIDPKELRRQRDRERYAQNRDEILRRKRQSREQAKTSIATVNNVDNVSRTPATGQSGVSQLQTISFAGLSNMSTSSQSHEGIPPDEDNILGNIDESNWLHRNDAYQMVEIAGRLRAVVVPLVHKTQTISNVTADIAPVGNDQTADPYGIFEPPVQQTNFQDYMEPLHNGEAAYHDPDEEARIFMDQDVAFESYHLGHQNAQAGTVANFDKFIYRNLPTKHHVLKKVPDCLHCGALRFPFEGPAFCCRKGKVSVIISYCSILIVSISQHTDTYVVNLLDDNEDNPDEDFGDNELQAAGQEETFKHHLVRGAPFPTVGC